MPESSDDANGGVTNEEKKDPQSERASEASSWNADDDDDARLQEIRLIEAEKATKPGEDTNADPAGPAEPAVTKKGKYSEEVECLRLELLREIHNVERRMEQKLREGAGVPAEEEEKQPEVEPQAAPQAPHERLIYRVEHQLEHLEKQIVMYLGRAVKRLRRGQIKSEPLPEGEPSLEGNDNKEEDDEEDNDPREYTFGESVWDTLLVAGLGTSLPDFVFLLFVALFNLGIQILFCLIVQESMIDPNVNENTMVNTALWRIIIGHKAEYYDPLTDTSLVTRVCTFPEYSIMAGNQARTYEDVADYRMPETITESLSTPLLCLICLMIWTFNILGDILQSFDFFRGLCTLPRSHYTMTETNDDGMRFSSISRLRLSVMTCMVIIPKFIIACHLGRLGLYYLVYTPSPEDLILNALALQCVLDMDEFLYCHLVPMRIRRLWQTVEPLRISPSLRYPRWIRKRGSMRVVTTLVLLVIILTTVVSTTMSDQLHNVQETTRLLCDGQQNFIYARDASTGLISTAETSEAFEPEAMFQRYAFHAVLQKTQLEQDGILDGIFSLDTIGRRLSDQGNSSTDSNINNGWGGSVFTPIGSGAATAPLPPVDLFDRSSEFEDRAEEDPARVLYTMTTSHKVVEMTKESFDQANDHLECADVFNEDTPAHLINVSVQAAFQSRFIGKASCSDLMPEDCLSSLARSFCPETCQCNIAISGMLNREGCSESCLVMVETQFNRDVTALRSVPSNCEDRDKFSGEFRRYFQELQDLLIAENKLWIPDRARPNFVWLSPNYLLRFAFSTEYRYWMEANRSVDLAAWAYTSYNNTVATGTEGTPCKFIEVIYKAFAFDACHPDPNTLGGKVGSLRSICPKTCGYCTTGAPTTDYQERDWDTLYGWMHNVGDIDMLRPVSYPESCALYRAHAPSFHGTYMNFCDSDVGLSQGFAGWFVAFKAVFPPLDVLEQMSSLDTVVLPSSTTTTSTTSTRTTSTSSTTTSTSTSTLSTTTTSSSTTNTNTTTTVTTSSSTTSSTSTTSSVYFHYILPGQSR